MVRFYAIAALAAAWFAALAIELLARVTHRAYSGLGAYLPDATELTFAAVRSHVPWIAVAAATIIIAVLLVRRSAHVGRACAALALATALGTSWAAFSIGLPGMTLCGSLLPEWHVPHAPTSGACRDGRS